MTHVGSESKPSLDRSDDRCRGGRIQLPSLATGPALQMSVLGFGQNVVFLTAGG